MNLMAYAVSGTRKSDAVLLRDRLYIEVVIGVFKSRLKCIMVNVRNRKLGFYARNADSLKFEVCHRSRCVLRKGLIYAESYFLTRDHFAADKVRFYDFLRKCKSHFIKVLSFFRSALLLPRR